MVRETFVNVDTNTRFGETDWYEPFTDSRGELFRSLQKEYGRPTTMRRDPGAIPCGWVFTKRDRYEGQSDTYLREVWVEVQA